MTPDQLKRKLAAILSADVKGYSRLMGEDEEGTIHTLKVYMEVITGLIQQHRGRVVATGGDSVLAEFVSVVDAVRCAVGIQEELKDRNKDLPEERRMEFRIGVNLGDVVEEGDNILGDGVNIAARVQSLAEAGGICIAGIVYDQIKNKLALGYEYVGEQTVKNIKEPIRVYRVLMEPGTKISEASASLGPDQQKPTGKGLSKAVMALIALVLIAFAGFLYQFILRPYPAKTDVASKEKMAFPLPDVPSIAVLPFVNMSEDPKQEFLCDGMTEAIITALSKVPRMLVIARNSTFTYKGKPVKVKQVSEDLGVRYVLEGSLQRSGDRLRINAQLIDALTADHLWAERYDRDLKDIFALQDEITIKILASIRVKLTEEGIIGRTEKYFKGKQGLDCYLKLLEAYNSNMRWNIDDTNLARRMAKEAIAMCPENPMGYIQLGSVYYHDYILCNTKSPQETLEKAIEMVQKGLVMDDSIAIGHGILCVLYTHKREYNKGIVEGERALALDPGGPNVLLNYAVILRRVGRPEEALPLNQKAIRLNPLGSTTGYRELGDTLRDTGRFAEAVSTYKKAIQLEANNIMAHVALATTCSMMGREKEAHAEAAEVLRINPKFSVDSYAKIQAYKDQSQNDKIVNALRKAGLK
jgi:adenylate cyclase